MKHLNLLVAVVATTTSGLIFGTRQDALALNWNWSYSGAGIDASGTLTTKELTGVQLLGLLNKLVTFAKANNHNKNHEDTKTQSFL